MDFILDLMKLDVPGLFCNRQGHASDPSELFKGRLHEYIASNGLSIELLKCVDNIMVSCEVIQAITTSKECSLSE